MDAYRKSATGRCAVRLRAAGLAVALALIPGVVAKGRDPAPRGGDADRSRLAFVLLREPAMPDVKRVLQAFARIAPAGSRGLLTTALAAPRAGGVTDALSFKEPASAPRIQGVKRFAWLLASVAKASGAEGIYWGDSGATHHAGYFAEVAAKEESPLSVTILTGLSEAADRGSPKRMSLLSLGMAQLGLLDMELSAPRSMPKDDALGFMFDLLSYVVKRGEAIPEGDTVGRTPEERLPVRYVPSPVDAKVKVWRVELPEG